MNNKRIIFLVIITVLILTVVFIKTRRTRKIPPEIYRKLYIRTFGNNARERAINRYGISDSTDLAVSNACSRLKSRFKNELQNIGNKYFFKSDITNIPVFFLSPTTPSGKILHFKPIGAATPTKNHFWMYVPLSKTRFNFYLVPGYPITLEDDEVSWYYQCIIDNLTSNEFIKEQEYRKEKELPPLKFPVNNG
ncbi:hypothetical protein KAH27_03940 [bacterium]|nr:hypothetical protein [bacterium]